MRLALFDPNCYKFTKDMEEYWLAQGHEVKKNFYYDPALAQWADILWFETCDNNIRVATSTGESGWKFSEMDMTGKKVICRIIDIDAWAGHYEHVLWDYVDDVIFIAPHIKKLVEETFTFKKSHLIPCGVNLDKFTFRKNPQNNKKIAWIAERWHGKGIDYFLQYAAMFYKRDPQYKIYSIGIWADDARGSWYKAYIDYFIKNNPMNVEFVAKVDDINEFLEDKSYTICFSKKEAFSYAIGEGMAKGLKPIIHNFYGCDKIWDKKYVWNTLDQAIDMTLEPDYSPNEYRSYIENNYSLNKMLTKFDQIIGG